jgi:hypothetical protein
MGRDLDSTHWQRERACANSLPARTVVAAAWATRLPPTRPTSSPPKLTTLRSFESTDLAY